MHHIEIYVGNLAQSRRFYSWLLPQLGFVLYQTWTTGFSYRKDSFYIVFVQTDDSKLQYGFNRTHVGINHLAFTASDAQQVDDIREQLRARHVPLLYDDRFPFAGGPNHYAVFAEDPDRIKIEVVAAHSAKMQD